MPDLDGYGCLIDLGIGPERVTRHSVLAWALMEDHSISALVLYNATLYPVQRFSSRMHGYSGPDLTTLESTPPEFVRTSLKAASQHFGAPHTAQCPDMAELQVALWHQSRWSFRRLEMWHLRDGDIAPMVDYQTNTPEGPRSVRIDARRYPSFAGLVTLSQVSQLKAAAPVQMDFFGLLPGYRT